MCLFILSKGATVNRTRCYSEALPKKRKKEKKQLKGNIRLDKCEQCITIHSIFENHRSPYQETTSDQLFAKRQ